MENIKMMPYCIINGCKNNGAKQENESKENDSNRNILFHVFPLNPELKAKWLKAIGRSVDWEPPDIARICSDHFRAYQISQINSKFQDSPVEVCRICLATNDDMTLYSLQQGMLKKYIDAILPYNDDPSLPQFVCLECAVHLRKSYSMIQKNETSQAVLLKLLEQNGEITKSLVTNLNREDLLLKSPLEPHKVTPTYVFDYKFNHEENSSCLDNIEYVYDLNETIKTELDTQSELVSVKLEDDVTENLEQIVANETDIGNANELIVYLNNDENNCGWLSKESTYGIPISAKVHIRNEKEYANHVVKSVSDHVPSDDNDSDVENIENNSTVHIDLISEESTDSILNRADINNENKLRNVEKCVQKSKVNNEIDRTQSRQQSARNEIKKSLEKYFNIENLTTLQERIDEWNKAMENPHWLKNKTQIKNLYKCEACSKLFATIKAYEQHRACHDPNQGNVECPVCKIRCSNKVSFNMHIKTHSKKYYCKLCPKSCLNESAAIMHYSKYHSGHEYKCGQCSYSTRHPSSLSEHKLKTHSQAFACEVCGRSCVSFRGLQKHRRMRHPGQPSESEDGKVFPCEECKLKFNSENALRVHLRTSAQHKTGQYVCKMCSASFLWRHELVQHRNQEHQSNKLPKVEGQVKPGQGQGPITCQYCDASLLSRHEHYWHMRRQHPGIHLELPDAAAICAICGKGYRCEARLRSHELRHAPPRERCEQCGRMFYDKFLLSRHHFHVHSEKRPYKCDDCLRAFQSKGNLKRHIRIHTGEKPYGCLICGKKFSQICARKLHMRTVHLGMPHPPRKKRKTRARKITAKDSDSTKDTKI